MKIDNDNNKDKDLRESRPGCKLPKKDSLWTSKASTSA